MIIKRTTKLVAAIAVATVVASSSATPPARHASLPDGAYLVWGVPKTGQSGLARRAIRVNQITFGVTRTTGVGTGGTTSRPVVSEVTFTKTLNNDTSPRLLQGLIAQNQFDTVFIKFVKNAQILYAAKLSDVVISGYSISSGGDRPKESVSLNFAKVEFKVGNQTTTPGTVTSAGWDLSAATTS